MNRILSILIILSLILPMSACNSEQETVTLADGTYTMEQTGEDELVLPFVIIFDGHFTFTYNFLSSHLIIGTYTIEGDMVTMVTDDNLLKYVFRVDGDTLIFQEKESTEINTKTNKFNVNVEDQARFVLNEEP